MLMSVISHDSRNHGGDRAIVCRLQSGLCPCPGIASRLRPNWAIGRLISDIIIVSYGVADSPSLPVSRNLCRFAPLESQEGTILCSTTPQQMLTSNHEIVGRSKLLPPTSISMHKSSEC